ncbi:MAG: hypothetical protein RR191_06750 [Cetobacterium sp.]
MDVFNIAAKISLDVNEYEKKLNEAKDHTSNLGNKIKSGLGTAAKIGGAAVTAAATGIAILTSKSLKQYAEYEQLVGGVETLFKDSSNQVMEYANQAYKSAGMSSNKYMSTITGFSASLLQSLEGDTKRAAEAGNQAVIDMADNSNKMGTAIESIQFAYQGFAKGNYGMLDNLKLGFGGTKEEMQRLLEKAEELSGKKYNISNLAEVYEAINVVQTDLGITGTTAKEASDTISGSLSSMKSAFSNLVTGLGDETADFDKLMGNFVDSAGTAAENIFPRIEKILQGIGKLITKIVPIIAEKLPLLIEEILPGLLDAGMQLLMGVINGLVSTLPALIPVAVNIIMQLVNALIDNLPMIIQAALDLIIALATGIVDALPALMPAIVETINKIVDTLTDPEMLTKLIICAIDLIVALALGLVEALPKLIEKIPVIIANIVTALTRPDMLIKLVMAALQIMVALAVGLVQAIPEIITRIPRIILAIVNNFKKTNWAKVGIDILKGILDGFSNIGNLVSNAVKKVGSSITGGIKKFFGIKSPSTLMKNMVGKFLGMGLVDGFVEEVEDSKKNINNSIMDMFGGVKGNVGLDVNATAKAMSGKVSATPTYINLTTITNLDGEVLTKSTEKVAAKKNLQYQFS